MSDDMAVSDTNVEESGKLNGDEASSASTVDAGETSSEPASQLSDEQPVVESISQATDTPASIEDDPPPEYEEEEPVSRKRRASEAFNEEADDGFQGFDSKLDVSTAEYSQVLERIQEEVSTATKVFTPIRNVTVTPIVRRMNKRIRQEGSADGSRPSSAMSSRSEGDGASGADVASSSSSPAYRGRRGPSTGDLSSPLLRVPLERGWKRELVYRAALDARSRRNADIYYYMPKGKKLRSSREVAEHLAGTGLTLENFSFFKEPLGIDDPEKEIIRDAKFQHKRPDVPAASPAPAAVVAPVEGKRTPKPKAPKGASPEPVTPKSPPAKIKVKSLGSRLGNTPSSNNTRSTPKRPAPSTAAAPAPAPPADNNNTSAWKKPSSIKNKSRISNGAPPTAVVSPSRRGRAKQSDTDYFTQFYNTSQLHPSHKYDVVVQIFQYLGMRELAHCARVCRLWRQLAASPPLWKHVRMKNSHVSDWGGLCTALKRHGTKRLDLRKMLLPQNDTVFWNSFASHISKVDTLERIELCRCASLAVCAVCLGLPALRSLSAVAIKDSTLDPRPLRALPQLRELRLKSMAGLSLTSDLSVLASLPHLQHLSLTSIKDLGSCACETVGSLKQLVSLELGECTFAASFGGVLRGLRRLQRLRLERGTAECGAPAILRALAHLPALSHLELVNFDVKVGFDDALAECKNIQRLLIIPTYVSQSATTNKQVLSGVLRLKDTLTHLMWGVTIELLRVTELFIDQCDQGGETKKKDIGECIPVLKPVPGCKLPERHPHVSGPPQVEILPLPTLQRLLSAQLPNTKLKLLRIPFHATWRQSLADFQ